MGCQPCEGHTYRADLNFNMKVLDFVKLGGPDWTVGSTNLQDVDGIVSLSKPSAKQ